MVEDEPVLQWIVVALIFLTGTVFGRAIFSQNLSKDHRRTVGLVALSVAIMQAPSLIPSATSGVRRTCLIIAFALIAAAVVNMVIAARKSGTKT